MHWFWNFGIYVLCYPIIQVLSTMRHEGLHALAAWFEGAKIKKISVLPKMRKIDGNKRLTWGFIEYDYPFGERRTMWVPLAPHICMPLVVMSTSVVLLLGNFSYHIWAILTIFGIISPFIDFTANYFFRYKRSKCGDFLSAEISMKYRKSDFKKRFRYLSTATWLSTFVGLGIAIWTMPV